MQMNSFNFLHKANISCIGYDKYMAKSENGQWLVFNFYFLFFQFGLFIFHKMYREAFLYSALFSSYFILAPKFPILFITLVFFTIIGMSFCFYKLYELKNNRIMHQVNYNPILFLNTIKPYKPLKSSLILFFSSFPIVWTFVFSFLIFHELFN
jgi:hypothetical protein